MKVVTIVGTRPEIIRLSECIKVLDNLFDHALIHTGQNYDYNLSQIFFDEMDIRKSDYFLNIQDSNLGNRMGNIIAKSYNILKELKPDAVLILGDTNSALSAISAKRLKIPIFHMEAGNRCYDLNVPEEINRKIVDHVSDVNLAYTEHARRNLLSEGLDSQFVFVSGSPLYEVIKSNQDKKIQSDILDELSLEVGKYFVASIHREENLDLNDNFINIIQSLNDITDKYGMPIIFTAHPRTIKKMEELFIQINSKIQIIEPLGYANYLRLQQDSLAVLSDSGTISEESAMLKVKAISIRTSTERPEAIDAGSIVIANNKPESILNSLEVVLNTKYLPTMSKEYKVNNVSEMVGRTIQSYTPIINKRIWDKKF